MKRNEASNTCPVHGGTHAPPFSNRPHMLVLGPDEYPCTHFVTKIPSSCPENVSNIFFTIFIQVFVKFLQHIITDIITGLRVSSRLVYSIKERTRVTN